MTNGVAVLQATPRVDLLYKPTKCYQNILNGNRDTGQKNEVKIKIWISGDVRTELSFLNAILRIDLYQVPLKYF